MMDCRTLLAAYANQGSESAFRELVTRYLGLVYSSALRLVAGDTQLAEDVSQTVFIHLAAHARRFRGEVRLGGWLHRDTCNVATKLMRGERRRRARERAAAEMNAQQDHSENNLAEVAPILGEAIEDLGDEERAAIILRFFEQYDFRAVGEALGSSEDAARMRVNRAIDKLHGLLKHRGVSFSAAALGTALATEAVTATPVGLAGSIGTAALASVAASGTVLTAFKIMSMTKIKAAVVGALVVAGVSTPLVVQHQSLVKLRQQNESLRQQLDVSRQLSIENERPSNQATQANNSLSEEQQHELLRLRGEVGILRAQARQVETLKKENLGLQAALAKTRGGSQQQEVDPATEQFRQMAIAKMDDAKRLVLGLHMYANDYTNQFVANLEQVEPYLGSNQVTGTNQFELVYKGFLRDITNPAQTIVIREQQPWPGADGSWHKGYGFADGHSEIHKAQGGDFDAWERERMVSSQ